MREQRPSLAAPGLTAAAASPLRPLSKPFGFPFGLQGLGMDCAVGGCECRLARPTITTEGRAG